MLGNLTRSAVRSSLVAALAALATFVMALTATVTAAVALTATALIVPGTGTPNPEAVSDYMEHAVDYYVRPTTESCAVQCTPQPVPYLAQFWPFPFEGWGGLSGAKLDESVASGVAQLTSDLVGTYRPGPANQIVIFGYSQGATVASREKALLAKLSPQDQADISFVLIGNPNRPNGGLFERLAPFGTVPILDATFGLPTPTDTGMATTDIAFQYDGVADFPLYPLNILATLNAVAGFWYTHGSYLSPDGRHPDELPNGLTTAELAAAIADPANQQRIPGSDTAYILIPTPNLPLLQPLRDFGSFTGTGFITRPLIDLIEPALRVLIETGYDRSLPYGQPAPLRLVPPINPITLAVDLADAVAQGVRDAAAEIGTSAPPAPAAPVTVNPPARTGLPPAAQAVAPGSDRSPSPLTARIRTPKVAAATTSAGSVDDRPRSAAAPRSTRGTTMESRTHRPGRAEAA